VDHDEGAAEGVCQEPLHRGLTDSRGTNALEFQPPAEVHDSPDVAIHNGARVPAPQKTIRELVEPWAQGAGTVVCDHTRIA
jgi:hypothetical protein